MPFSNSQWNQIHAAIESSGIPSAARQIVLGGDSTMKFPKLMITVSAGSNGSVSPSGGILASLGSDLLLTASPDLGYGVDTWSVNSVIAQTGGNTFTLVNIQSPHTVVVTFSALPAPPAPTLDCFFQTLSWTVSDGVASTNIYRTGDTPPITFTFWLNSTSDTQDVLGRQFYRVASVGDGVIYAGESEMSNIVRSL